VRYQTFEQAQLALDQKLLSPFNRAQGQQLINERRQQLKESGKEELAARRRSMKETSAKHISRYEGAASAYEMAAEAIEDGDLSLEEAQKVLADAKKRQHELAAGAAAHLDTLERWEEPENPEAYGVARHNALVQQMPALRIAGRHAHDPLEFPW